MSNTILIVDDSESIRELVSSSLINAGFDVIKGENGEDGLSKLSEQVKLIISDVNMPIMDGISLVKEVRKLPNFQYVPIVMLTTESQAAKKDEARKAGATAWIVKPFEEGKLLNVVKRFVR